MKHETNTTPVTRESFVFYRSFYEAISACADDAQLALFKAVCQYGLDQEEPSFDGLYDKKIPGAIWTLIRPQLDANEKRFRNGCLGGAPKGSHNNPNGRRGRTNQELTETNQELTKNKPNVNDNDNVNDNVNVNISDKKLILPFDDPTFVSTWEELCQQPKWRVKTPSALRKSLDKLAPYDVRFAIHLMEDAIANNYQGVVFSNTPKDYEQWRRSQSVNADDGKVRYITSIDDLYPKKSNHNNEQDGTK